MRLTGLPYSSGAASDSGVEELKRCGFVCIGNWTLGDFKSTKHLAHLPGIAFTIHADSNVDSFVYSFSVEDQVVYVGESSRAMGARFASYRYGNPVENDTDNRVKIHITEALVKGHDVRIWCYSKSVSFDLGGEIIQISVSKPIEEVMIRRLGPILNNTA